MEEEKLKAVIEFIRFKADGGMFTAEEIESRIGAVKRPSARTAGVVAVLPVYGVISHRMNMMTDISGGTSTEQLSAQFKQVLNDPNVKAIVFDVDSPGGGVAGVEELASEIFAARGQKKMVSQVNSLAASAAYWIASAADEIVVTPSGMLGSIGVIAAHDDVSEAKAAQGIKTTIISAGKYKSEAGNDGPLSEQELRDIQAKVDAFYEVFTGNVAKFRGVAQADVKSGYGEGRTVLARDAVKMGMADKIATFEQTLARFGASSATKQSMKAEDASKDIAAKRRELELHV